MEGAESFSLLNCSVFLGVTGCALEPAAVKHSWRGARAWLASGLTVHQIAQARHALDGISK